MSDQLPVDTSVITPVTPSGGGASGPPSSAPPMTLGDQTTTTQTEVPNYLSQYSNPITSATNAPVPQSAPPGTSPTSAPASAPTAPTGPTLPSIQVMFEQLKNSKILLSDITIKPTVVTSPLDHLQPEQLINSNQGPQPAFVVATQPAAASAIQLASTAPPVVSPNSQHVAQYIEKTSRKPNTFVMGIIVGLGLVVLFAGGVMAYRYYVQMTESSTIPGSESYDAVLDAVPFTQQGEDGTPEAVWYQEQ